MKSTILAVLAAATIVPATAGPAFADRWDHHRYERDRRADYVRERRLTQNDRIWRGRDGRYHCRRSNGTTGLIVGAGVGALLGRTIDTDGDRTLGTVLGAAGGGLLGRSIERGNVRCR